MSRTNLAQHEQYLKSLEHSLTEICDHHKQAFETMNQSWNLINQSWDMTLNLFGIMEHLRQTRFALEKEEL